MNKESSMTYTRKLGRSGIQISAMGLGCWAIGGPFWSGETPNGWGEVDDAESTRAIHRALDLGITFFDTANVYGAGHSERVLASALGKHRKQVVIATKFNAVFDETTRHVTGSDTTPEGIRKACTDSLLRLNTDYIDLYQFHNNGFPSENAQPIRDTLEELVNEGLIRSYGWSTDFPKSARFFAEGEKCTAIQLQLNVFESNPSVLSICEKYDLAAINRGPLAMGLLTNKYTAESKASIDDVRGAKSPEWMKYFKNGQPNPDFLKQRDAVSQILTSSGRTLSQGALAWLWARSAQTIPIPGFRTVTQVDENCKALQKGPLTPQQMQEIDKILGR
jgi:aryl-alcohol dehydrogenase-like predicted oxidoreductase